MRSYGCHTALTLTLSRRERGAGGEGKLRIALTFYAQMCYYLFGSCVFPD
jgi:hypothetical protein